MFAWGGVGEGRGVSRRGGGAQTGEGLHAGGQRCAPFVIRCQGTLTCTRECTCERGMEVWIESHVRLPSQFMFIRAAGAFCTYTRLPARYNSARHLASGSAQAFISEECSSSICSCPYHGDHAILRTATQNDLSLKCLDLGSGRNDASDIEPKSCQR